MIERPSRPRILPLREDERDDALGQLLVLLRTDPQAPELNIFSTLARHGEFFKVWLPFGGFFLLGGDLPARDREFLVLRTAFNCRCDYERGQHLPLAATAGVTKDDIALIEAGPDAAGLAPLDAALLRAADELHAESCISDPTWHALASSYNERQLIEACALVGHYHLLAFTLNSLGIEREPGVAELPD